MGCGIAAAAVVLVAAWAGSASAQESQEGHAAEPAHASAALQVTAGEPVVAVMGCLMEGHGETHDLVLGQVQLGAISMSGLTTGDAFKWTRATPDGIEALDPMNTAGSEGMRARAEYAVGASAVALDAFVDQQVRITAILRSADGQPTLHPLRISPIGAVCAGGH